MRDREREREREREIEIEREKESIYMCLCYNSKNILSKHANVYHRFHFFGSLLLFLLLAMYVHAYMHVYVGVWMYVNSRLCVHMLSFMPSHTPSSF